MVGSDLVVCMLVSIWCLLRFRFVGKRLVEGLMGGCVGLGVMLVFELKKGVFGIMGLMGG